MEGKAKPGTAADAVMRAAHAAGIDACFANPGTTEMWMVSALDKTPGIRACLGLHEAVCTGACDGYARMAGRPALALLHLGPGLGNGLCNLHNARRARSPAVVLVGDMATWHRAADPPLNSDLESLAATQGRVVRIDSADSAAAAMAQAVAAANEMVPAEGGGSAIVTVVLPHDISWQGIRGAEVARQQQRQQQQQQQQQGAEWVVSSSVPTTETSARGTSSASGHPDGTPRASNTLESNPGARAFIKGCAQALKRAGPRGKAAILLGGRAALEDGEALHNAGLIAAACGAAAFVEPLFARLDRGSGRPHLRRLAYFPQEAATQLASYEVVLLVDTRRPVAPFGYDGGPSQLLSLPDDCVWEVDAAWGVPEALSLLAAELGAPGAVTPGVNCGGLFPREGRPPMPPAGSRLTAAGLCQVVAALQPEGCIVVDESLTSGVAYWEASKGCPPFSHLTITGGSIGCGPPMALGAAVACPGRHVINLQADGSAMYSLQALWSQAREGVKVLTIICANSSYAILKVESARQGVPASTAQPAGKHSSAATAACLAPQQQQFVVAPRPPASLSLTSLSSPPIDWVKLAEGMGVPGGRAGTVGELTELVQRGMAREGPFLIMAAM